MELAPERYIGHIRAEAGTLACPDWNVYDLVAHTSAVHRWAAEMIRNRATQRLSRKDMPAAPVGQAVIDWFEEGVERLLVALQEAGPDAPVWNWAAEPTAAFWFRRQAQETAVHRWDTQSAAGSPTGLDSRLALDGIDELFTLWLPDMKAGDHGPGLGGSLHVHATDGQGEWTLRDRGPSVSVEVGHGKGDAAIRGTASDLLLFLWGRPVEESIEIFGNSEIPRRWHRQMRL